MSEDSNLIELFPAPEPIPYNEAQSLGLTTVEEKALLMMGFIEPATPDAVIIGPDPEKSRRVEGEDVVTSLRAIEQRALRALKAKSDKDLSSSHR